MYTFLYFSKTVLVVIASFNLLQEANCKKKHTVNVYRDDENDVLEKSEVIFKFPTYAVKIPPILTSRRRSNSKVHPVPVTCNSSNVTKSLNELRKKVKCIPRDTVVEITAPEGSTVVPNTVVVKRCGGMCTGGQKCISTKKTQAALYVRSTEDKSMMVFCNRITVPEDLECKCGCGHKKKHKCLDDVQKYDEKLCKCICINTGEHRDCLNKANFNFQWEAKTCSCGCRQEKKCTTGSVWVREKCKCIKQ